MSIPQGVIKILQSGLQRLGVSLSLDPLLAYLTLLQKWNKAYNLTAVRELEDMATRHILDSLAITPWIKGTRVLDVGTGAGLPGIPLALHYCDWEFVLLDSNGKRTRFLQEVKRELNLRQVEIAQSRIETYLPATGFDTVVSRAFATVEHMVQSTKHVVAPQGVWVAMKGQHPVDELASLTVPYHVIKYDVPGEQGERCCVTIKNI